MGRKIVGILSWGRRDKYLFLGGQGTIYLSAQYSFNDAADVAAPLMRYSILVCTISL